jgi:hypothetical protein
MSKKIMLITTIICLLAVTYLPTSLADQGSAKSAVTSTQQILKDCYFAVKKAESTGANITQLIATLNDAATDLSKAQLAYASQNYDSAYTYAIQCQNKLSGIGSQANELTANAQVADNQNSIYTLLLSTVSIALVFAGFGITNFLSKKSDE